MALATLPRCKHCVPRPRALALALSALLAPASAWAIDLPNTFQAGLLDPAVAFAYVGPATPDKLAAALTGFRQLLAGLPLINPPSSGSISITSPVGPEIGFISDGPSFWPYPTPALLTAASDADFGPGGMPVTLAHARLRVLGSFETGRDFIIGHPDHEPTYIPSGFHRESTASGGPGWIDTNGHDLKITGIVTSHQKLYKEGSGTLWLTGTNGWHAVPEVHAGVLMGDSNSLATDIINRGQVSFMQMAHGDYANAISGDGSLHKSGAGDLQLRAIQRFTGATRIEAGSLSIALGDALHSSSSIHVAAGARLDASAAHEPRLRNLSGAGQMLFGASSLRLENDQETHFSGHIAGAGELLISGSHTFTLSGDNGHLGGTRITFGKLAITRDAALGRLDAPLTIQDDGRLILRGDIDTARPWIAGHGSANVDTGEHTLTLRTPLTGHATKFGKYGNGHLILTAPASYAGQWQVDAGTLQLHGTGALAMQSILDLSGEGRLDLSAADGDRTIKALNGHGRVELGNNTLILSDGFGRFGGVIAGNGGLTVAGASSFQELSGFNTYSGATTILDGTLRARPASLSDRIINHGRLELFDHGGLHEISAYSGNIAGSGQVVKTDTSVIWLRGRNSYSGGTLVEAGALIGNTDSLPGDIETRSLLAFYQVENGAYSGRVSGSGTLMSYGPGALTLTGVNTHDGGTAFSNTLRIFRDANLGGPTSRLLVAGGTLVALDNLVLARHVSAGQAGAHFDSNGHSIRLDGRIDGPGGVTKLGDGVLYLAGAHDYAGATTVHTGGMVVNGSLAGNVEVHEGAWLHATGQIGGNLAINPGASFSAGNSPGMVEVIGDFIARGELLFEIASPTLYDSIRVGGVADVAGATFRFHLLPGVLPENFLGLTFLTAAGGITGLDRASYVFGAGQQNYRIAFADNALHLAPVPEAETWAMLLAGLGLIGVAARRRALRTQVGDAFPAMS